ncbi:MAG: pyridoxal 5-phosphate synthase pdxT subunit [Actinomycetota bacterium]|nr:pyridoxal 5-phosphate synthase pdxT subunit [Actinomycetota bacterium]
MTLVGVLGLQGDVREHRAAMAALGVDTSVVRTAEELAEVDGLIIPGGESTAMSLIAQRVGMIEPLRAAVASGLPMYGSCAGMIMLAREVVDGRADQQTLAALDIVVRRNAFGRQVDSFEADLAMPVLGPQSLRAVFIRAPWVESVGPGVEVLGTVAEGPSAGRIVAVRSGLVLATSFHPELLEADLRVHGLFRDMVDEGIDR